MNIVKGRYTTLSSNFSPQLRTLCANMLHQEPSRRPSVNDILAMPFLACRIGNLLPTQLIMEEFSHTVRAFMSERKPQAADQTKEGGINGSGAALREGEGATSAHFEAASHGRYHAQSAYTRRRQIAVVEWLRTKSNKLVQRVRFEPGQKACVQTPRSRGSSNAPTQQGVIEPGTLEEWCSNAFEAPAQPCG